jgi:hypothetical protein
MTTTDTDTHITFGCTHVTHRPPQHHHTTTTNTSTPSQPRATPSNNHITTIT